MIEYKKGDATKPKDNAIVAHICNDVGAWGAGFVIAISRNLGREAENHYDGLRLPIARGKLQLVAITERCGAKNFYVANMIAQNGVTGRHDKIDYVALDKCLSQLGDFARQNNCSIQMPRIGCGLAGSTWQKILPYLEKNLEGVEVTVFDLP